MLLLKDKFRKILRKIEVDKAVFFGVLAKVWAIITGPVTLLLIAVKFTPEYQGYYYTFSSLLALQVFVELGLSTVIIQFASHEWSKLKMDDKGGIIGDTKALSRLISLARITFKWYLVGGALIAFGLGVGGYIFFLQSQTPNVSWALPWFSLCLFSGISVALIPLWSLLEGCNQVAAVYRYRFLQGIVASLSIWIAIFSGANLWSASISLAATIVCAALFLKLKYSNFIQSLFSVKILDSRIDWRKEIFPMQWRIALSWISGYFIFSLFTPVIFHYYGPVIAGQFGMTWSIIGIVSAVSSPWLYAKVPKFGMLIAEGKYRELDGLFGRVAKVYAIITVLAALGLWLIIYLLNQLNQPFSARLLPVLPTTIFLAAQVVMILSVPFPLYLRAHKKEPFLLISALYGVLTAFSTFTLGKYYSVTAIGLGYLAINLGLVPLAIFIWQRCRAAWHSAAPLYTA